MELTKKLSASIVASIFLFFVPIAFASAATLSITSAKYVDGYPVYDIRNNSTSTVWEIQEIYPLWNGSGSPENPTIEMSEPTVLSGDCTGNFPHSIYSIDPGGTCSVTFNNIGKTAGVATSWLHSYNQGIRLSKTDIDAFLGFTDALEVEYPYIEAYYSFGTSTNIDSVHFEGGAVVFIAAPWAPPILTPSYPPARANTLRADLDFYATGTIAVATTSAYTWNKLDITLWQVGEYGMTFWSTSTSSTLASPLAPGDTGTYSIDVGALSLPTGAYKVLYDIWGYDPAAPWLPHHISYADDDTIIRDTDMPTPATSPAAADYPAPTMEDCSSYSPPNSWFCEIKNSIEGLIIPSQAKLAELQSTIGQVQNRAPFNYLTSAATNIQLIIANTSSTPVSITIFGTTSTLDFTPMASTGLSTIIQAVISFILLILFVFWGLNYIKRIF